MHLLRFLYCGRFFTEFLSDVGYKKGDAFPRVALTHDCNRILNRFPDGSVCTESSGLLSNFEKITAEIPGGPITVNSGAYGNCHYLRYGDDCSSNSVLQIRTSSGCIQYEELQCRNICQKSTASNESAAEVVLWRIYYCYFQIDASVLIPGSAWYGFLKAGSLRHCDDSCSAYGSDSPLRVS